MRTISYKVKAFRLSEEVYKRLKQKKGKSSWNLFFKHLIEKYDL